VRTANRLPVTSAPARIQTRKHHAQPLPAVSTNRHLPTAVKGVPAPIQTKTKHPVNLASRGWLLGEGAVAPKTATPAAAVGPNPTDRGKDGSKRHVLTEGRGVPLATIITAANVNDHTALPTLLAARVAVAPPRLERPGLCLDAAYDNGPAEDAIAAADYTPHIRRRGEARPPHDPRVEPR